MRSTTGWIALSGMGRQKRRLNRTQLVSRYVDRSDKRHKPSTVSDFLGEVISKIVAVTVTATDSSAGIAHR